MHRASCIVHNLCTLNNPQTLFSCRMQNETQLCTLFATWNVWRLHSHSVIMVGFWFFTIELLSNSFHQMNFHKFVSMLILSHPRHTFHFARFTYSYIYKLLLKIIETQNRFDSFFIYECIENFILSKYIVSRLGR